VEQLASLLKSVEQSLKLPEIPADGPQLLSELPMRLAFSIVRLGRDDPTERALVEMLKQVEPEYVGMKETMLIPVFGRGRAVSVLPASKMDERSVGGFAQFMCGACSCEVKEMNPGMDLLMAVDWEGIFGPGAAARLTQETPAREGKAVAIPGSLDVSVGRGETLVAVTVNSTSDGRVRAWLLGAAAVMGISALISGIVLLRRRA
jgi:hypothetical protein